MFALSLSHRPFQMVLNLKKKVSRVRLMIYTNKTKVFSLMSNGTLLIYVNRQSI